VRGSVAGDKTAFAQIYDRYADRLHDFSIGMLRDRDGAADCVQEVFCIAATRLPALREPDRLRPWLYAIARNEALRRLRELRRETPSDDLPDMQSEAAGPDTLVARGELADLIAEAAGGLTDRDRAVLDLVFRHGLNGPDLADALGVSNSNANNIVQRLRQTIQRSLGALLVSRRARSAPGDCAELDEMLADWDGQFTVLMRKRISRHVESCPICDDERRRLVSPAALLGAAPVLVPAPQWLRDKTLSEIRLTSHGSPLDGRSADGYSGGGVSRRTRRLMIGAVQVLAVLGASAFLAFGWLSDEPVAITPAEISGTAPEPTGQSPPDVSPPQAPMQPPGPAAPVTAPPPVKMSPPQDPLPVQPPVSDQAPQVAPPVAPEPPEAATPPEKPSVKPPMSFSPTVVAPPASPPEPGGNDAGGGSGRTGRTGAAP
jgi:RNA polymerase sigma factor (sigma-70 family)